TAADKSTPSQSSGQNGIAKSNNQVSNENKKATNDLVGSIKNSFKQANKRIRYQSNCLPETDKFSDFLFQNGDSPSGLLASSRRFRKSWSILYSRSDEDKMADLLKADNPTTDNDSGQQNRGQASRSWSQKADPISTASSSEAKRK